MAQVGLGAAQGALSGAVIGSWFPGPGTLIGAIVGGVIGAGVGAAAMLMKPKTPPTRYGDNIIVTTNIRDVPVPIIFGRGRVGGNWIEVGSFWETYPPKDLKNSQPSLRWRIMNGILAICEGQVFAMGNIHQDGQPIWRLARQNSITVPERFFAFHQQFGAVAGSQPVDTFVNDTAGLEHSNDYQYNWGSTWPPTPYSNTALLVAHTVVGSDPRLPNVAVDVMGPDYTIRRTVNDTGETNSGDVAAYAFYDSYSTCFYYTLSSSATQATPFGLARVGREATPTRSHTPPPTGVSSVSHAWYLGRHDVLVMQHPSVTTTFYVGSWGFAPTDAWETHQPRPESGEAGYENPILVWHLDELHGILHSLHDDGTTRYIMQWWLLSGRVQRLNTGLGADTFKAIYPSVDLNCYIVVGASTGLSFIDKDAGTITQQATASVVTSASVAVGVCVSGQLVGVLSTYGCQYYDSHGGAIVGVYGASSATDASRGVINGTPSAYQNTYSGHVTLVKQGNVFVNFIPSIPEAWGDIEANGSSGLLSNAGVPDPAIFSWWSPPGSLSGQMLPERDFQYGDAVSQNPWKTDVDQVYGGHGGGPNPNTTTDWVRDWSHRTYNFSALISLQGNSSLAAAAWAAMTKYQMSPGGVAASGGYTSRFGAGLDPVDFDLGSFEGLHAYCVGVVVMTNPNGSATQTRWAERYKFDFVLDGESSVAQFVNDEILVACQGYRLTDGGILRVGTPRAGQWPVWHFTEAQMATDSSGDSSSFAATFIGKTLGINRVRLRYREVLNEYQDNFAEANDEWDQNARGRVQPVTVSALGVGRFGHADILAKAILDQSIGGRRQVKFDVHFVGWVLNPTDGIEVSNAQCAFANVPMTVVSLTDTAERGVIEVVALEHLPTRDALGGQSGAPMAPGGGPYTPVLQADNCDTQIMPIDGTINWYKSGSNYFPGTYTVSYQYGAYSPDLTWQEAVAGADIVTMDGSGTIIVLCSCPAVSIANPGWPTYAAAEAANAGQSATFTLSAAGPIGIRHHSGTSVYSQVDSDNNYGSPPAYQLCPPGIA